MSFLMNLPEVPLKCFVFGHMVLVTWGYLMPFLSPVYLFSNYFAILLGIWAIKEATAIEPAQYFLFVKIFTILNDIICLAVYFDSIPVKLRDSTFNFSAAMAIINLLVKPLTCLYIYKEWQTRGGGAGEATGNYQDIDSGYGKPAAEPMP